VNEANGISGVKVEAGDARALRILRENARLLERLVASYARSEADRADLRQDVALALWSALPSFRGDCSERTFLLRVAHNRAMTFLAKRGVPTETIEDHADRVVTTSGKNPALAYEHKEQESRLLAAVRAVPVPLRQVITLLLEGLSYREIASVLGTTETNVGVRAHRARAAIRVLLDEGEGAKGASS
jgi:RNA polymerase sigma-70 factor (ECF subfamily)